MIHSKWWCMRSSYGEIWTSQTIPNRHTPTEEIFQWHHVRQKEVKAKYRLRDWRKRWTVEPCTAWLYRRRIGIGPSYLSVRYNVWLNTDSYSTSVPSVHWVPQYLQYLSTFSTINTLSTSVPQHLSTSSTSVHSVPSIHWVPQYLSTSSTSVHWVPQYLQYLSTFSTSVPSVHSVSLHLQTWLGKTFLILKVDQTSQIIAHFIKETAS